jgi:hypothetical protein
VRRALYLSGQLRLFHIYPVNMVNSKKEYSDKMVGNHFEHLQDGPKGKVQRTPRGTYFVKCRSLLKFLTAKNGLF